MFLLSFSFQLLLFSFFFITWLIPISFYFYAYPFHRVLKSFCLSLNSLAVCDLKRFFMYLFCRVYIIPNFHLLWLKKNLNFGFMLLFEIFQVHIYCCTYYILIYALHIMDFSRFLLQSIKLVIYFFVQVYCLLPSSLHKIALFLPWPVFILYILTLIYIYSKTTWVLWKNNLLTSWDLVYVKIVCFVSFCASVPLQTWIELQFFIVVGVLRNSSSQFILCECSMTNMNWDDEFPQPWWKEI